jgi:hypothetical protein
LLDSMNHIFHLLIPWLERDILVDSA